MPPKKSPEELAKEYQRIVADFDKELSKLTPEQREKLLQDILEEGARDED